MRTFDDEEREIIALFRARAKRLHAKSARGLANAYAQRADELELELLLRQRTII